MPDKSYQELIVTNFGLSPSGYTGSQGYVGSAGAGVSGPRITSIAYPGDDTAASITGGDTITLTGANFAAGAMVVINGNAAGVVSVVNSTTITFTAPPNPTGSYILYVVNTDGATTIAVPGLQYSGTPAWSTPAGTLGTFNQQTAFSANVVATGDAPITYSVYSGSLPSGITLTANTGVLTGTLPNVSGTTTYSFTIRATDAQRQDTDRAFSLNVIVAAPVGQVAYTSAGTYSWTVPSNVQSVCAVLVGGGYGGQRNGSYKGGRGAAGLRYINNLPTTPGEVITVVVGGGYSSIAKGSNICVQANAGDASGFGGGGTAGGAGPFGGTIGGGNGGSGGYASDGTNGFGGYGGAGGYSGNGGDGGSQGNNGGGSGYGGAGGGGGGSSLVTVGPGGGGSVGIYGEGTSGAGGGVYSAGGDGSGGGYGTSAGGAVRIIWGDGRAFPSTLTTDRTS